MRLQREREELWRHYLENRSDKEPAPNEEASKKVEQKFENRRRPVERTPRVHQPEHPHLDPVALNHTQIDTNIISGIVQPARITTEMAIDDLERHGLKKPRERPIHQMPSQHPPPMQSSLLQANLPDTVHI